MTGCATGMEAMALGLPVVVTAAGGVPEMVDDGVEVTGSSYSSYVAFLEGYARALASVVNSSSAS